MLSEMGVASIEAIAMVRLIRYLKRVEQMEKVDSLRLSSMTYCEKERRIGCNKVLNGLASGVCA